MINLFDTIVFVVLLCCEKLKYMKDNRMLNKINSKHKRIALIGILIIILFISISLLNIDYYIKALYDKKLMISKDQPMPTTETALNKIKDNHSLLQKNVYITELFFIFNNGYYRAAQEEIINERLYNILDIGSSAIDIGASDGRTVQPMLDKSKYGKIIAFEPDSEFYNKLNLRFNGHENVIIENCAVFDKSGEAIYYSYSNNPWESGLSAREGRMQTEGNNNGDLTEINIITKTLDEFINDFESIDMIKIDAESSEMNILIGGENLIKKFRPVILTEFGSEVKYFNHNEDELFDFVKRNNYYLCDLFGNIFHSKKQWKNYLKDVTWDFLLIPEEKYSDLINKIRE